MQLNCNTDNSSCGPASPSFLLLAVLAIGLPTGQAWGSSCAIFGTVSDISGAAVPGASVSLDSVPGGPTVSAVSAGNGTYCLSTATSGTQTFRAAADGFAGFAKDLHISPGEQLRFDIQLQPAALIQQVTVSASQIVGAPEEMAQIPGSVEVIDKATLSQARVFTFDEALRKASGVNTRGEEGFGLRPNIGIRGLNPTRSSKVLLLEDGLPLSYAPYGDNASYYHPPVDRFDSIEIVKGAGQILYGPSTVGGVINYLTPQPPPRASGSVTLLGGSRDYLNAHARFGATIRNTGLLFDAMRKQGEGARDSVRSGLDDYTVKVLSTLTPRQSLSLKGNYYHEDSQLTYSGLREDEWAMNPRYNPFLNDHFYGYRYGAAAQHTFVATPDAILNTNLYGAIFRRDWWRQSSNSGQRPNRSADAACGGMYNLYTTCGNEGRLRDYYTWGVEPRLRLTHRFLGMRNEADLGFRAHFEDQERVQQNGHTPTARVGAVVEDNQRRNQAYSGFVQNRFIAGKWAVTPGVRMEHVRFQRLNRLANGGLGVVGETSLTQLIPGVGVSFSPSESLSLFTGIHRGFAPPRTEDVISNSTGRSIELDSELSWNYELGLRARAGRRFAFEAAWFRMPFENQIVPSSVAGGAGAVLTNGGRTMHQGFELAGKYDFRNVFASRSSFAVRTSYTYIPVARFEGIRFSNIPGFAGVLVSGNRLPYAPRHLVDSSVIYTHAGGFNAMVEMVATGRQFGDDLNTVNPTPDGQRGAVPGNVIWNVTANYPIEAARTTLFITTKNLLDRTYVVDRTRGLLPGMPRVIHAGVRFEF